MSVALDKHATAKLSKNAYDAEFELSTVVPQFSSDTEGDDDWCLVTCGVFTCMITG